jgi:lipoyl(octanoyl) transferase
VWVANRKIASIGIGVKKWISMHGFGLNVSADLSGYESIVPCGIANVEMTSIAKEMGGEIWSPQNISEALAPFIEAELLKLRLKA